MAGQDKTQDSPAAHTQIAQEAVDVAARAIASEISRASNAEGSINRATVKSVDRMDLGVDEAQSILGMGYLGEKLGQFVAQGNQTIAHGNHTLAMSFASVQAVLASAVTGNATAARGASEITDKPIEQGAENALTEGQIADMIKGKLLDMGIDVMPSKK